METIMLTPSVVTLDPDGKVTLPSAVLKTSHLGTGDRLFIIELSNDTIVLKKLDETKSAIQVLNELGAALRRAGYGTREKVDQLVDEIKREVTEEWLAKMRLRHDASC
ncbi:MAG: AbrB/MazE/SpoVT family DNA-binding domain-containing protein [Chloroflexi bacterium]|nr:AbrB/MazE/SpoVT family DNA-binding domain-containing protein [Chloroflexota bacterium]